MELMLPESEVNSGQVQSWGGTIATCRIMRQHNLSHIQKEKNTAIKQLRYLYAKWCYSYEGYFRISCELHMGSN